MSVAIAKFISIYQLLQLLHDGEPEIHGTPEISIVTSDAFLLGAKL